MREIGSSVRFLRDKFVPLYSERGYSDKDIRNKEVLALFSCGFVPFLSRQNFVSWCKILQVADLKRLVRMIKGRISLTTSNHQYRLHPAHETFYRNHHQNQSHETHHHIIARLTQDIHQLRRSPKNKESQQIN